MSGPPRTSPRSSDWRQAAVLSLTGVVANRLPPPPPSSSPLPLPLLPLCRPSHLQAVALKHARVFEADGNAGLVHQALATHTRRRIERMTRTFVAAPLLDVALAADVLASDPAATDAAKVAAVEKIVSDMVSGGPSIGSGPPLALAAGSGGGA